MRKLFLFMMISLDGFFEGPNHEIIWHNVDDEFNDFAISQLNDIDLILFGRKTYELMVNYWPTEDAKKDDPIVAELMNKPSKIVFSKTLKKVGWENTRILRDNAIEVVRQLKERSGKEIAIFGSSDLCVNLMEANLLDELRIMINPIMLGNGKKLFQGMISQLKIKLVKIRSFASGNVLLYYHIE